jgi:hypothetical protein
MTILIAALLIQPSQEAEEHLRRAAREGASAPRNEALEAARKRQAETQLGISAALDALDHFAGLQALVRKAREARDEMEKLLEMLRCARCCLGMPCPKHRR